MILSFSLEDMSASKECSTHLALHSNNIVRLTMDGLNKRMNQSRCSGTTDIVFFILMVVAADVASSC